MFVDRVDNSMAGESFVHYYELWIQMTLELSNIRRSIKGGMYEACGVSSMWAAGSD